MQTLRDDFSILTRTINGKPLVYLDNAATSQKPAIVIDALKNYYERMNANIHRGIHTLADEATREYEEARDLVAEFINSNNREEVIFTRNATEAINLVAYSWGRENLYPGDEVIVSIAEHHANFVPWQRLAQERGVVLKIIGIDEEGRLRLRNQESRIKNLGNHPHPLLNKAGTRGEVSIGNLQSLITDRTRLIAVTHASNVLGTVNDIKSIVNLARPKGILVLIDGAQAVPHIKVDVQELGVDFYAFSAHKMMGPAGVGVLWGRKHILEKMPPFLTGGDMIKRVTVEKTEWNDLPWKFEAGTPGIADVIAAGVAVEYLTKIGFGLINRHEYELGSYAIAAFKKISGLTLYGPKVMEQRVGVFSFNIEGIHAHDLATLLDEEGIAIRSGHHCAHPLMDFLRVPATARASLYLYNTKDDIDRLVEGIERAKKVFDIKETSPSPPS